LLSSCQATITSTTAETTAPMTKAMAAPNSSASVPAMMPPSGADPAKTRT
jgi:hypothetical protein